MDAIEASAQDCYVDRVPENAALMIDAMALIQSLGDIPGTFGEVADTILANLVRLAKKYGCHRVDFVVDRYPDISMKNVERSQRASQGTQVIHIHGIEHKTPKQWKKYLSSGQNKEALVEFLFSMWKNVDLEAAKQDMELYITHGDKCHRLEYKDSQTSVSPFDDLACDHEEADTRLLLHAKHAAEKYDAVAIKNPDTDVGIIAISLNFKIPADLYFMIGVRNRHRIIDLQKITTALSPRLSSSLIGLHTFSRCDSTSAFYGRGKKKAFTSPPEMMRQ
ncbi:hypothetical protein GJAV_G00077100 [Gymnothorax javanicus]|nr:hypothetical protein GJAV_G00077100 [Gymnothorax javanicus]